jgi:hypothetical protein
MSCLSLTSPLGCLYQGRLAIKYHPDKNPDDPLAEEKFKEIAIAYQTLSDPALRKKYNEFGSKESQPEGGFVDPEEIFGAMFGGERFAPIIGQISLAKDMKSALQEVEESEGEDGQEVKRDAKGKEILSEEEKARRDEKEKKVSAEVRPFFFVSQISHSSALRKQQLVQSESRNCEISSSMTLMILTTVVVWKTSSENLAYSPSLQQLPMTPTSQIAGALFASLKRSARIVHKRATLADIILPRDLKKESYGVELLQAIGFVYISKSKHYLATNQTLFGVGGWFHNVSGKYHVFSET